jgi:hypothetical protein
MLKRIVLVVAMACVFSACSYIGAYEPPWLRSAFSPPPPQPQRTTYSTSYRRSREHARIAHRSSTPAESGEATTGSAPAANERAAIDRTPPAAIPSPPPVSLSLAGDSGDREEAKSLLKRTDANLAQARARSLNREEQETYDRASQLANRARRALADNDCAAASSLAGKALSLASGISGE